MPYCHSTASSPILLSNKGFKRTRGWGGVLLLICVNVRLSPEPVLFYLPCARVPRQFPSEKANPLANGQILGLWLCKNLFHWKRHSAVGPPWGHLRGPRTSASIRSFYMLLWSWVDVPAWALEVCVRISRLVSVWCIYCRYEWLYVL